MMDSLCDNPRFCSMYEHRHCCDCRAVLDAQGEGPVYAFDRPIIDGYANGAGNAVVCSGCGDDFFLLCKDCAAKDSRCPQCRAEVVAA